MNKSTLLDNLMKLPEVQKSVAEFPDLELTVDDLRAEYEDQLTTGEIASLHRFLKDSGYAELAEEVKGYMDEDKTRVCSVCGALMNEGYTDGNDYYYCSDECLAVDMNKFYDEGNWRSTEEENTLGGFYENLNKENGEYEPIGIYWTTWYE